MENLYILLRSCLVLAIFGYVNCQSGNCQIDDVITPNQWLRYDIDILDTATSIIFQRPTTYITGIISSNLDELWGDYVTVSHENNTLTYTLLEEFINYERRETALYMQINVLYQCTIDTREFRLRVNINDTNNHEPVFEVEDIEFNIFTPMPAGMVLTPTFNDIIVEDVDLTTYNITFAFTEENAFLEIDSLRRDGKKFYASLRVKAPILNLPPSPIFRISATDNDRTGDPPLTTFGNIRLVMDPDLSLPATPVFRSAYYISHYETSPGPLQFNEIIQLSRGYIEGIDMEINENYRHLFRVEHTETAVTVIVIEEIPGDIIENNDNLLLELVATVMDGISGTTVLQINFPRATTLKFSESHYEGQYENNNVTLSSLSLSEGYTTSVVFSQAGDYEDYFALEIDGNSVQLITVMPLTDDILENHYLILTLNAQAPNALAASTTIVITLPSDDNQLVFDQLMYEGQYDGSTLNVGPINILSGYSEDVTFGLLGDDATNFTSVPTENQVLIVLNGPISEAILESRTMLSFTLAAYRGVNVIGNAAINIALPEMYILNFDQATYEGSIVNNTLTIPAITLTSGISLNTRLSLIGDLRESFTAALQENTVSITFSDTVAEEVFNTRFILLSIEAFGTRSISARAALLIVLEHDTAEAISFDQSIYEGTYTSGVLNLPSIRVENADESDVEVELHGPHDAFFQASHNNGEVSITTIGLPDDIVNTLKYTALIMQATKEGTPTVTATLILAIITEDTVEAISFDQSIYEGTYTSGVLNLPNILVESGDESDVEVELHGPHDAFFQASYNSGEVFITTSGLPDDIANTLTYTAFTIQATKEGTPTVTATLILAIITEESAITIEFEHRLYDGLEYILDPVGIAHPVISFISNYGAEINLHLDGDYQEHFQANLVDQRVEITVINPLPIAVINDEYNILLILSASTIDGGFGFTVLSIDLPNLEQTAAMKFDESIYEGTYLISGDLEIQPIRITEGFTQEVDVNLIGVYSEYFDVTNENEIFHLISSGLPENVIDAAEFVSLTIQANKPGAPTATAAIILTLPKSDAAEPISFDQSIYEGTYTSGVLNLPSIRVENADESDVEVELLGSYDAFFHASYNNGEISITTIGLPDDIVDTLKYTALIMQATKEGTPTVTATLILAIITEESAFSIEFEHRLYDRLEYILDPIGVAYPVISIISNYDGEINLHLDGGYREHFQANLVDQRVEITVINPLPLAVINDESNILLILSVSTIYGGYGFAVLSIDLPNLEPTAAMKFDEFIYEGTYLLSGDLEIQPIRITEGLTQEVEVNLIGVYSEYFNVTNENEIFHLISSGLPENVIDAAEFVSLTIQADKPGAPTATAAIILTLPKSDAAEPISFDKSIYEGTYTYGVLNLPSIRVENADESDVEVELLGSHDAFFHASYNNGEISITTIGLPDDIVDTLKYTALIMQATKEGTPTVTATLILAIITEESAFSIEFEHRLYDGLEYILDPIGVSHPVISIIGNYDGDINLHLDGDYLEHFQANLFDQRVEITVINPLPLAVVNDESNVLLILSASTIDGGYGFAVLSIDLPNFEPTAAMKFDESIYEGTYLLSGDLEIQPMMITEGFTQEVEVNIIGVYSEYFNVTNENEIFHLISSGLPENVIDAADFVSLTIQADKPGAPTAIAAIILTLPKSDAAEPISFDQSIYEGTYTYGVLNLPSIRVEGANESDVVVELFGPHDAFFQASYNNGEVSITTSSLPDDIVNTLKYTSLTIQATKEGTPSTTSTLILAIITEESAFTIEFEHRLYDGLQYILDPVGLAHPVIAFIGNYDGEINISLDGDYREHFQANLVDQRVEITVVSSLPITVVNDESNVLLILSASTIVGGYGFAVLSIDLPNFEPTAAMKFDESIYEGTYLLSGDLEIQPIIITEGFTQEVEVDIIGVYSEYFNVANENEIFQLISSGLPENVIDAAEFVSLTIQADKPGAPTAIAAIILTLPKSDISNTYITFENKLYTGLLYHSEPLNLEHPNLVFSGVYEGTVYASLDGEYKDHFVATLDGQSVTISIGNSLPSNVISDIPNILLILEAYTDDVRGFTVLSIDLPNSEILVPALTFVLSLYEGEYESDQLLLPRISLTQSDLQGIRFSFSGLHNEYFNAVLVNEVVTVTSTMPETISTQISQLLLILEAATSENRVAHTVLYITYSNTEITEDPTVSFNQEKYTIAVKPTFTGDLLTVFASSSNGESIIYSLNNPNDQLSQRLFIDPRTGTIGLSAYANVGHYEITVEATTATTRVQASADIEVSVNHDCTAEGCQMDPLSILQIIEEQPYEHLVTIDEKLAGECVYEISEEWPLGQSWFYIDSNGGISCRSVNREHPTIAFMTLSQVRLELLLRCGSQYSFSNKSLTDKFDHGSHSIYGRTSNEGDHSWIIAENITFSNTQRVLNIIVEDINDNPPIFVETSPFVVGYPIISLVNYLMPPSLVTVHATDADIGINAKIRYSTDSQYFVVHPHTGVIYPRDNSNEPLITSTSFVVFATDEGGDGPHSTPLTIQVNLLEADHLLMLSVRGALMEDIDNVTQLLSSTLSYRVKSLKSAVLPNSAGRSQHYRILRNDDDAEEDDVDDVDEFEEGELAPSLMMFIYAMDSQRNFVSAETIRGRIESELANSDTFYFVVGNIPQPAETIDCEYDCDMGLVYSLAALSGLLILVVLVVAVWLLIRHRMKRRTGFKDDSSNSDTNSLDNHTVDIFSNPENRDTTMFSDSTQSGASTPPRVSLQNDVTPSAVQARYQTPSGSLQKDVAPSAVESGYQTPSGSSQNDVTPFVVKPKYQTQVSFADENVIIENSDDDDEFGEAKKPAKKSVVFNEVVESIRL